MTAGSAASRRVLARTPVAPLPASSPTRPTGITGRMSAPPETSSPEVCSFRLPQMCGFRLPLTHASTAGRGAAIFWQPNSMAKGDYTISASFTQTEPSGHPNAYGLFFGGSDLSGATQGYSYFVIRQGGEFLVTKRMGDETSAVVDWTAHDAINDLDDQGRSSNTLAVEVGSSQVRFLVNGTEVTSQPRSAVDTDGITGLRVNHLLDVHIGDLDLGM